MGTPFLSLIYFSAFLISTDLFATNVIRNADLKSRIFGSNSVTLELTGLLKDTCTTVSDVQYEQSISNHVHSQIQVYLSTSKAMAPCIPKSKSYIHDVFLGDLSHGNYEVFIYEDSILTYQKSFTIPDDALPELFEFDYSRRVAEQNPDQSNQGIN